MLLDLWCSSRRSQKKTFSTKNKETQKFSEKFLEELRKMAWGFWSASTVSDRGRSPRRATTANSSAIYYQQPQQQQQQVQQQLAQPQQQQQCNVTVNQCMQAEEANIMPIPVQQQRQQSVCGSPCQSVCHTPTCISPSCQSGTTGKCINNQHPTCFILIAFFLQNHPNLSNVTMNNVKNLNVNIICNNSSFNKNNCSSFINSNSNNNNT